MRNDELYLQDLSDACGSILDFVAGMQKEAFLASDLVQSAVIQKFIVMGEAASRISEQTRADHPEVDWRVLTSFRNFLVHTYFQTILERVWQATLDVQDVKEHIDAIIRFRAAQTEG